MLSFLHTLLFEFELNSILQHTVETVCLPYWIFQFACMTVFLCLEGHIKFTF